MNQQAYQEITKMLNAFPQSTADIRGLLLTYDEALTGLDDGSVCATAAKFVRGEVSGQNKTFAPSIAEFRDEVRKTPVPGRLAISPPQLEAYRHVDAKERARMRLKVPLYDYAIEHGKADELAKALDEGFNATAALAANWGVSIPVEFSEMPSGSIESEWRAARNRAWAEIDRNPPPFIRRREREASRRSDLPVIMQDASHEDFKRLNKSGQLPTGATWVACLATIFGPRQSMRAAA